MMNLTLKEQEHKDQQTLWMVQDNLPCPCLPLSSNDQKAARDYAFQFGMQSLKVIIPHSKKKISTT